MRQGTANYLQHLFSTDGSGQDEMMSLLEDGKWVKVAFESNYDVSQEVTGVLLSRLIPISWAINLKRHPVVIVGSAHADLDTSVKTKATSGVGGTYTQLFSTIEESKNASVQYDGKTLWLMDAHDCTAEVVQGCSSRVMYALPGLKELTVNNTKWGSISYSDMAIS